MTTLALTTLPLADSYNMHGGWAWGWMVPMMLGMVLFWGAVIFGIFWLIREGVQRRQSGPEETALTILDRHFADGTLSLADYHQRRSVLTGEAAPRPDRGGGSAAIEGS
jgi:putative membrane protein